MFSAACGTNVLPLDVSDGSGAGEVAGSDASAAGRLAAGSGALSPVPIGGAAGSQTSAGHSAAAAGGSAGQASGAAGVTVAAGSGGRVSANADHFSFFVTSYAAMQRLSGSPNGFGGNLTFGKADGLSGADEICRQIAEHSLSGAGSKSWHAFLSATKGANGKPVNAIERVGAGPWYDRLGRLVAHNKADLAGARPTGADASIINDLPNEDGVPNHAPDGTQVDNHDVLTGSSATGTLYKSDWKVTCHDWTSAVSSDGKPRVGHSWPRSGGGNGGGDDANGGGGMNNWISALDEAGCAAGASLVETGGPDASNPTVGSGGGYGAIYCFALTP
jgi:hypothetical protein